MGSSAPEQAPEQRTEEPSTATPSAPSYASASDSGSKHTSVASLRGLGYEAAAEALSPLGDGPTRGGLAFRGSGALSPDSAAAQTIAAEGLSGPSSPIPAAHAHTMKATTGVDVSHGRVHTGPAAQQALTSLGVEGFTMGGEAAIANGARPDTAFHEYAHIAQQTGVAGAAAQGKAGGVELSPSGDLEAEADAVADAAMHGKRAPVSVGRAPSVKFRRRRDRARTDISAEEQEAVTETHRAENAEIIRLLRGHTSDGDVRQVLEILSVWPMETITSVWQTIDAQDDYLDDFCDNVGTEHFRAFPRECVASFQAMTTENRWNKLLDLTKTGFLNGVSEEEAYHAYLLLQSCPPHWTQEFQRRCPEHYAELRDNLPSDARRALQAAMDPEAERQRQAEEQQRRGDAAASAEAARGQGGVIGSVQQLLDDRGLFESVDANEARQALDLLYDLGAGLSSVVQQLETQGKIDKLIDALSHEDKYQAPRVAKFLSVLQCRPPVMALHHIEELLSTGLFDWSVSAEEARLAYYLIKSQPVTVQQRFRERDSGNWLERMDANLGADVANARGGEEGDAVLNGSYGTASSEAEAEAQRQADEALRGNDDAWAGFQEVVSKLQSGDAEQAQSAFGTLSAAETPLRQAMVRRLDGMSLLDGMLDTLGYDYLWADGRRHVSLSILQVRDPMRSIGQMQHVMSLGLFDWAVTSEEAYLVYQLIRALPPEYQARLQETNPELYSAMLAELNNSQNASDDLNAYQGGEDGQDRVNILDQLADPAIWDVTDEAGRTRLRNVLMMGIAAGHRRVVNELARAHGAFETHAELMSELNLSADYQPGELAGTNYWNEGVFQWTAETAVMIAQGIDALAQVEDINVIDELAVRGVELDEVQDAMGGSLAGVRFANTDGDQDHINSLDMRLDPSGGALHVQAEQLAIESINYQDAGMTVRTGAGTLTGLLIDATFPTSNSPDRETTFLFRLPAVEFRDIMVILPDQMWTIAHAVVNDFELRSAEMPVPAESMSGDGRGAAVLAALKPQDALLNQVIAAVGVAQDYGEIMGQGMSGYGGMSMSIGAIDVQGVSSSTGVQVDRVAVESVQLNIERLPSRGAEARIAQLQGIIASNAARIEELQAQTERTEVDAHELTRLNRENQENQTTISELQAEIPAMQQRETRFLELYARHRRGEDLGSDNGEFMALRDEFELQVTGAVGSVQIDGAGMGGQGSGQMRFDDLTVSGGGNAMGALGGYINASARGEQDLSHYVGDGTQDVGGQGNLEIRAGRMQASNISAMGTIPDYNAMAARLNELGAKSERDEEEEAEFRQLGTQWTTIMSNGMTFGAIVEELRQIEADGSLGLTRGADHGEASASAAALTRRNELREVLRAEATTIERIDARGLGLSVSGQGQATTGGETTTGSGSGQVTISAGELQVDNVRSGDISVEQVTGTGMSLHGGGALTAAASGDVSGTLAAGGSVESLTVRNVDHAGTGTHVGLVDLRDASASVDTSGDGTASMSVGRLTVSDVTQTTRLAQVEAQIAELEGLEQRSAQQQQQLERLQAEAAELRASGENAETVTHVDNLNVENFSTSVEGFGNPLEEGYDIAGRDLTIRVRLGEASVGGMSYTDGSMTFGVDRAHLSNFELDVKVGVDRDEQGAYTIRPESILRNLSVGSAGVTNLHVTMPMANEELGREEMVSVELPTAVIQGLSVAQVPLDNFDPLTMTGAISMERMHVEMEARVGDYFEAGGAMTMTDLSLGAIENGDVSLHLGDLTLQNLGFRQTGDIPDGSIVSSVRGMGGQISRLGGISADVTLNRESGAVTFSAGLGTFQMPHLNYAGGGHVARVTSGVTLSNASLRGRAQFDMAAVQAGDTANALQSLNVDRFHIDEVAARGLHYENSDYNAVVDLAHGYLRDITLSDFDMNSGAFDFDLGSAGVVGLGVQFQQTLENGEGQRLVRANASASLDDLHIGAGSDGSYDFDLTRAGIDSFRVHLEQTGSTNASVDIGGSAQLRGMSGGMGADGSVNGRVGSGDVNVDAEFDAGGASGNIGVRGDVNNFDVGVSSEGAVSANVGNANLNVTGQAQMGGQTVGLNYDLSGFSAGVTYNPDGSFSTTLNVGNTGIRNVFYRSSDLSIGLGSASLQGLEVGIRGRVNGSNVDVTIERIGFPTASVTGLECNYQGKKVELPSATMRGFLVSGVHIAHTSEGTVVDRGHAEIGSIDVNRLSAEIPGVMMASANANVTGLYFDVTSEGEYAFGMTRAGFSAGAGYMGAFNLGGVTTAEVNGVRGTHGANGTQAEIDSGSFAVAGGARGDSVTIPGSEGGQQPTAEEWAQRTLLSWDLPFLDELNGHVGLGIPVRSRMMNIRIPLIGRIDPDAAADLVVGDIPDGLWGWAPSNIGRRIMRLAVRQIATWLDEWIGRLSDYVEPMLNSDPNAALPEPTQARAEATYSAQSIASSVVDSLGAANLLIDVGTRNGRGILRTIGDGVVNAGLWVADGVGIDAAGDELEERREELRQERIDALVDWLTQITVSLDARANGGIAATNMRDRTNVFRATASARVTGNGNLSNGVRLGLDTSLSNISANVGSASVTVDNANMRTNVAVGAGNNGVGGGGGMSADFSGARISIPSGGGGDGGAG